LLFTLTSISSPIVRYHSEVVTHRKVVPTDLTLLESVMEYPDH